jgi:hypothetical protein
MECNMAVLLSAQPAERFTHHLFPNKIRGGALYRPQHLKPIKSGVIRFPEADAYWRSPLLSCRAFLASL